MNFLLHMREDTDDVSSQEEEKIIPYSGSRGSYHLSAQQYIWHLSLLLLRVSLHDQH